MFTIFTIAAIAYVTIAAILFVFFISRPWHFGLPYAGVIISFLLAMMWPVYVWDAIKKIWGK